MLDSPQQIGPRLKRFREAKGYTQQELELAIGTSFGHLSRIESGKLNPTKETLLKIAKILQLDDEEIRYLIGVELDRVTKKQIELAIQDTKTYIDNSSYPSYLADDYFFVHYWNKRIPVLFEVSEELASQFIGKNILEIILHPLFKKMMKKNHWESLFINDMIFFLKAVNYFLYPEDRVVCELISKLSCNPEFTRYWEEAKRRYTDAIIPGENLIYLNKKDKEICYYMSTINVVRHPRFRIVEYVLHP